MIYYVGGPTATDDADGTDKSKPITLKSFSEKGILKSGDKVFLLQSTIDYPLIVNPPKQEVKAESGVDGGSWVGKWTVLQTGELTLPSEEETK